MNRVLAVLVLFFVVSCGGSRQQPGARRASSNVLTQQEIAATPVTNAYEALERLRPRFLRPQSTATRTQEYAVVYVDGVRRANVTNGPAGDISLPAGTTGVNRLLVIGAEKHDISNDFPSYAGLIDEVRLSNVRRYTTTFTDGVVTIAL